MPVLELRKYPAFPTTRICTIGVHHNSNWSSSAVWFCEIIGKTNFKQAVIDVWRLLTTKPFAKILHSIVLLLLMTSTVHYQGMLKSYHVQNNEEADIKIIYHACTINYQAYSVIRSIDTDIDAIMLCNDHHLQNDLLVWMLTGSGMSLRYVYLKKIKAKLEEPICKGWTGFHAIAGCG